MLIWPWGLVLVCIILVGYFLTLRKSTTPPPLQPDRITFSIEKVTKGLPNTVIFRYDLGGQQVNTLELQQTWDDTRRITLDTAAGLVTTTYMSPGYFNAKLVADGKVVKTRHLYLPSNNFNVYVIEKGADDFRPLEPEEWQLKQGAFTFASTFASYKQAQDIDHTEIVHLLPEPIIFSRLFFLSYSFYARNSRAEQSVPWPWSGFGRSRRCVLFLLWEIRAVLGFSAFSLEVRR